MHPVRMILSSPFVPQPQRKTKHIFGQKGNSKLLPCVLQEQALCGLHPAGRSGMLKSKEKEPWNNFF